MRDKDKEKPNARQEGEGEGEPEEQPGAPKQGCDNEAVKLHDALARSNHLLLRQQALIAELQGEKLAITRELERVQEEANKLLADQEKYLCNKIRKLEEKCAPLEANVEVQQSLAAQKLLQIHELEKQQGELLTRLNIRNSEITALQRERTRLKKDASKLERMLANSNEEIKSLKNELKIDQKKIENLQAANAALKSRLIEERKKAEEVIKNLRNLENSLVGKIAQLETELMMERQWNAELTARLRQNESDREKDIKIFVLIDEKTDLQKQLAAEKKKNADIKNGVIAALTFGIFSATSYLLWQQGSQTPNMNQQNASDGQLSLITGNASLAISAAVSAAINESSAPFTSMVYQAAQDLWAKFTTKDTISKPNVAFLLEKISRLDAQGKFEEGTRQYDNLPALSDLGYEELQHIHLHRATRYYWKAKTLFNKSDKAAEDFYRLAIKNYEITLTYTSPGDKSGILELISNQLIKIFDVVPHLMDDFGKKDNGKVTPETKKPAPLKAWSAFWASMPSSATTETNKDLTTVTLHNPENQSPNPGESP